MFSLPFDIGRLHSGSRILLLFLCVGLTLREISASAHCIKEARLSVFTKNVEQKGYRFEKLEVNRSEPVSIIYRVITMNLEVDSVNWKHNDQEIHLEKNPKLSLYYVVDTTETGFLVTLNVSTPNARSTGMWTMVMNTKDGKEHIANCYISSPPILRPMTGAVRTNIGSPLSVNCPLDSTSPNVLISWSRVVESPDGQKILQPVDNATFRSEGNATNVIMEWSDASEAGGLYLCTATSARGKDSTLIEVRIKDYKTYLWPAVGILIEIILLAITIAAYEISQSKKRKAEQT